MGVLLLGWFLTILVIALTKKWLFGPTGQFTDEMLREVLAGWIGELLFFTVVGAIITIVTLRNPMHEAVEERIRIMFWQSHVPDTVMKYNKSEITRLYAYAKTGNRQVILDDYDQVRKSYRAMVRTEYELHNLFPDIHYNDSFKLSIVNDDFGDNPPPEFGRITSIQVGTTEMVTNPLIIKKEGFTSEVKISIAPAGSVLLIVEYYIWIKVGKNQSLRPKRVVEQFSMEIVSRCDKGAKIDIDGEVRVLVYNQAVSFALVHGVSPGERIAVYTPLEPA
jgi:hypothetical protein